MENEIQTCAAAFFRTSGKDVTTADEFVMSASLELKWMAPSKAKKLLALLENEGAVQCKNGYVRLSPELQGMDLPLAYKPSPDLMAMLDKPIEPKPATAKPPEAKPIESSPATKPAETAPENKPEVKDTFHVLMDIAVDAGIPRKDFIQNSNKIQRSLGIDIGAAALIVLRDGGVDIRPYIDAVYKGIEES
ncbi:MAG: DUF2240 family protein [Candidatus Methanomethylophilaceae archaeon]|nr:DUF2240 family protein [Candidatus Methanomethylophilaceae archaeon]